MRLVTLFAVFSLIGGALTQAGSEEPVPELVLELSASYPGANGHVLADTVTTPVE